MKPKQIDEQKGLRKKDILISILICLLFPFTYFVSGPLQLYMLNVNEFWFHITALFPVMLVPFLLAFGLMLLIVRLVRPKYRDYVLTFFFALGLCFYLQGNVLPADYGQLDGHEIKWQDYDRRAVINTGVWILALAVPFVMRFLVTKGKTMKAFAGLSGALLLMQTVAIVTVLVSTPLKKPTEGIVLTQKNMFALSEEKNVLVFVPDTFDVEYIDTIFEEDASFFEPLEGFTYFRNCVGSYSETAGALPFLILGEYNYNDKPFKEFGDETWTDHPFYEELLNQDYNVGIYTASRYLLSDKGKEYVSNATDAVSEISSNVDFFVLLNRLVSFRYMPHLAKSYFSIASNDFDALRVLAGKDSVPIYSLYDPQFYQNLIQNKISIQKENGAYRLYHLGGAHTYYIMDENSLKAEVGTVGVYDQIKGCFNIIYTYIEYLKELGIYEDATIIISADHGRQTGSPRVPGMLVKKAGDVDGFTVSNAPVSHSDIQATIMQDVTEDYRKFGSSMYDIKDTDTRDRYYYFFNANRNWRNSLYYYDFEEYVVPRGMDANEVGAFVSTGREFTPGRIIAHEAKEFTIGSTRAITEADDSISQYALYGLSWIKHRYGIFLGNSAKLVIPLNEKPKQDLIVNFEVVETIDENQTVIISVGDNVVWDGVVKQDSSLTFTLPASLVPEKTLELDIEFPNAISPYMISEDVLDPWIRSLAISEMTIKYDD